MPEGAGASLRLHVVTDDEILDRGDFMRTASAVLEAGMASLVLHVRGPRTNGRRVHEVTSGLARQAVTSGTTVVVNDRVDVALAIGSIGAHLGRRSLSIDVARELLGPDVPIGCSCHSVESARVGSANGATYLLAGNVFDTPSHPGSAGRGVEWMAEVVSAAGRTPVAGIGGVRLEDVRDLRTAGAAGVAVLRGIWDSPDPAAATVEYIQRLNA